MRTPQTTDVDPMRTTALPEACVREEEWLVGGRAWVGFRPEGRVGGSLLRWASRKGRGESLAKV